MHDAWAHLQQIARTLTVEYGDAVFIGGVAVASHAIRLGAKIQETSHDAGFCLSIQGKAALRDRYEVRRRPYYLGKDSVFIEGEDIDLYVERQHPLGIPYPAIFAFSEDVNGIRVAALEHLLILKLDAARSPLGSPKGEKAVRDLARIVALVRHPREKILAPQMNDERKETLERVIRRNDLPPLLGLNFHEGSRLRVLLDANFKAIARKCSTPDPAPTQKAIEAPARKQSFRKRPQPVGQSFVACGADLSISSPLPLRGEERLRALRLRTRTLADVCAEADVRCRVSGGISPLLVLWDAEHHGYTMDNAGIPLYAVSMAGLPQRKQQRALRILEILAYGFQDYIARESVCGRGFFVHQ